MTEQHPLPEKPGQPSILQKIGYRRLSIAIMLVGAAGFVAALLLFDQQVLCLSGSTLVTLGGLALLVTARRMGLAPAPVRSEPLEDGFRRGGRVPPGLRKAAAQRRRSPHERQQEPPGQLARRGPELLEPIPPPASRAPEKIRPEPPQPGPIERGSLADRAISVMESQGAQVVVEQVLPGRAILLVRASGGQESVALVLERGPVGTADTRALLALVNRYASDLGYLIARDGFLPEAYEWASGRGAIRLVSGDEIDELGI